MAIWFSCVAHLRQPLCPRFMSLCKHLLLGQKGKQFARLAGRSVEELQEGTKQGLLGIVELNWRQSGRVC